MTDPPDNYTSLLQALADCTVAISADKLGSGFFVSPGLVLTCAHVVSDVHGHRASSINVVWNSLELKGRLITGGYYPKPGPDVALLEIFIENDHFESHPYVLIDARRNAVNVGDRVVSYGFPERDRTGDIATFEVEGPAMQPSGLAKLKVGQAEPGMSGAPVLNLTTGAVCGMLRYTRDRYTDLGARFLTLHAAATVVSNIMDGQKTSQIRQWLQLLTDSQIHAGHHRFADSSLREYLSAASAEANIHPYAVALGRTPPLETVYVHQLATPTDTESNENASGPRTHDSDPGELHELGRLPSHGTSPLPTHGPPILASSVVDNEHGAVVIGGPGAGKSSLLKHLTATLAHQWLANGEAPFVPIRISAEVLAGDMSLTDALATSITHGLGGTSVRTYTPDFFRAKAVADTPWLVMVDGVDEVLDKELRLKILNTIDFHRDSPVYKFLIASRPLAKDELSLIAGAGLPMYFIEPFSETSLSTFAAGWFEAFQVRDAQKLLESFERQMQSYNLRQLMRIPLIATMTCIVFVRETETLPASRRELYAKFIGCLFGKQIDHLDLGQRLNARFAIDNPRAKSVVDTLVDRLRSVLQVVAYERQAGSQRTVSDLSRSHLKDIGSPQIDEALWEEIFWEALRQCGLLIESGGDFKFIHQSIEEYLAASQLVSRRFFSERRRADILLGIGRGRKYSENVRLFLASIWIDGGNDLHRALKTIIDYDTPEAALFIASLTLDGSILPGELLISADKLLTRRLGLLTVDNSGFLSIQAILLLQEAMRTQGLMIRASDHTLSGSTRAAAISSLGSLLAPKDVDRIRKLTGPREPRAVRVAAAKRLAATGAIDGRNLLISMVNDSSWPPDDRIAAARELGMLGDPECQSLLSGIARDRKIPPLIRVEAAASIVSYSSEKSRELLLELSYSHEGNVDYLLAIAHYLGRFWQHPRGLTIYENLIGDRKMSGFMRLEAATGLSFWDRDAGKKGIFKIATDSAVSPALRMQLIRYFNNEKVTVAIYKSIIFDSTVEDVYRIDALQGLAGLNSNEARNAVSMLVEDTSLARSTRLRLAQLGGHSPD